ncbi:MAG: hypothetical protein ABI790_03770 [Betaproteobacteria bacterium]
MLRVAARFAVSSSYMARICTLLHVPRPDRGYWAKLAFGKASAQPLLPTPRPGDMLSWSRDGTLPEVHRPLPRPPDAAAKRTIKRNEPQPTTHHLVSGAKPLFAAGRIAYHAGYLKPAKYLLVDLAVSKTGLDKALAFANELFLALEARGHRVVIAPQGEQFQRAAVDEREQPSRNPGFNNLWRPGRCTVVYIGTLAIGLTIIEMSEEVEAHYVNGEYVRLSELVPPKRKRYEQDHGWTSKRDFPSGRLCLQAYSPYGRAQWTQQWRETSTRDIASRIPAIVKELEVAAIEIARLVEEGARQAAIEHERWIAQQAQWQREEAERHAVKALKDSKEELLQIVETWSEVKQIEAFFADAEQSLADLPESDRQRLVDRLKRAREMLGSTRALDRFLSWRTPDER